MLEELKIIMDAFGDVSETAARVAITFFIIDIVKTAMFCAIPFTGLYFAYKAYISAPPIQEKKITFGGYTIGDSTNESLEDLILSLRHKGCGTSYIHKDDVKVLKGLWDDHHAKKAKSPTS